MTHDDNLARVQALRDDQSDDHYVYDTIAHATLDHVEDVLTRHAPLTNYVWPDDLVCQTCSQSIGVDWPCPDYTSALTLLDALDGGGA